MIKTKYHSTSRHYKKISHFSTQTDNVVNASPSLTYFWLRINFINYSLFREKKQEKLH